MCRARCFGANERVKPSIIKLSALIRRIRVARHEIIGGTVQLLRLATVAQWIEYWPPKPGVVGSIPASRAKYLVLAHPECISISEAHGYFGTM